MPRNENEEDLDEDLDEEDTEEEADEEGAEDGADSEGGDEGDDADGDESDDPEVLRRQRDAAFARAKKAEAKLKASKNRPPVKKPAAPSKPSKQGAATEEEIEDFVDLRVAGYSREEIRKIRDYARTAGVSPAAAAKTTFVKAGIEAMRAKAKTKAATPSPSNRPTPAAPAKKQEGERETRGERQQRFRDALDKRARSRG